MNKEELDRKTTPPNWCKDAVLTTRGWKDPKSGELLIGRRVTQEEVDHFMNRNQEPQKKTKHTKKPIETPENEPTTTETLTPDERDGRDLLEETDYDTPEDK